MPKMPIKAVKPTAEHLAFRTDLINMLRKFSHLRADEMLGITAHFIGQLIALQDQRIVTPEMAMEIVKRGIERGNAEAMETLLGNPEGSA